MKVTQQMEKTQSIVQRAGPDADIYDVKLSHAMISLIDRHEFIIDILPRATLRYTIEDAEKLVQAMHEHWTDGKDDPYYNRGDAIFPLVTGKPELKSRDVDVYVYTSDVTIYRYKLAGEYVYGVTNRYSEDAPPARYVEAPLDGWEKWLADHKRVLSQRWQALYS